MFVSRSVLKKKLCANFSEKKNITESNNLAPPPPQKSNGASLILSVVVNCTGLWQCLNYYTGVRCGE